MKSAISHRIECNLIVLVLSGGFRGGFRVIPFVFKKAKAEDGIASVDRFERRHPVAAAMTHARMN